MCAHVYLHLCLAPSETPLVWQRLCNAAELMHGARKLTKEEELLRERQRQVATGITGYTYDEVPHAYVTIAI